MRKQGFNKKKLNRVSDFKILSTTYCMILFCVLDTCSFCSSSTLMFMVPCPTFFCKKKICRDQFLLSDKISKESKEGRDQIVTELHPSGWISRILPC